MLCLSLSERPPESPGSKLALPWSSIPPLGTEADRASQGIRSKWGDPELLSSNGKTSICHLLAACRLQPLNLVLFWRPQTSPGATDMEVGAWGREMQAQKAQQGRGVRILDKEQMATEVVYKEGGRNCTFSKSSQPKEPQFPHLKAWDGEIYPIYMHTPQGCKQHQMTPAMTIAPALFRSMCRTSLWSCATGSAKADGMADCENPTRSPCAGPSWCQSLSPTIGVLASVDISFQEPPKSVDYYLLLFPTLALRLLQEGIAM